jgi:hypothetical protein
VVNVLPLPFAVQLKPELSQAYEAARALPFPPPPAALLSSASNLLAANPSANNGLWFVAPPPSASATLLPYLSPWHDATLTQDVTRPASTAPKTEPLKPHLGLPKLSLDLAGYSLVGGLLGAVGHVGHRFANAREDTTSLFSHKTTNGDSFVYKLDEAFRNRPVAVYESPKASVGSALGVDLDRPMAIFKYPFAPLKQKGWFAGLINGVNDATQRTAPAFDTTLANTSVVVLDPNGRTPLKEIRFEPNDKVIVDHRGSLAHRGREVYNRLPDEAGFVLTHRYGMSPKGWKLHEEHTLFEQGGRLMTKVRDVTKKAGIMAKEAIETKPAVVEEALTSFPLTLPATAKRVESFISGPLLKQMFNLQGLTRFALVGSAFAMVGGLLTEMATSTRVNLQFEGKTSG